MALNYSFKTQEFSSYFFKLLPQFSWQYWATTSFFILENTDQYLRKLHHAWHVLTCSHETKLHEPIKCVIQEMEWRNKCIFSNWSNKHKKLSRADNYSNCRQ